MFFNLEFEIFCFRRNTLEYCGILNSVFNFIRCALAQTVFDHADDHVIEAGVVSSGQGLYLGGERLRDVERLVDGLHLLFVGFGRNGIESLPYNSILCNNIFQYKPDISGVNKKEI